MASEGGLTRIGRPFDLFRVLDLVLHRFRVEGIDGLPPEMAVLRMSAQTGQYADVADVADVADAAGCQDWEVSLPDLVADNPDEAQQHACWQLARAVRAVGDGLQCTSARDQRTNMPLYPDRPERELSLVFVAGSRKPAPRSDAQRPLEQW
jgi:hypothetical protein